MTGPVRIGPALRRSRRRRLWRSFYWRRQAGCKSRRAPVAGPAGPEPFFCRIPGLLLTQERRRRPAAASRSLAVAAWACGVRSNNPAGSRSRERSACAASVTCSKRTIWASSCSTDQPALVNRGIGFAPDSSGGNRMRTAGPTSESAQPRHRPMGPNNGPSIDHYLIWRLLHEIRAWPS
jgi:hypothetical protein